LAKEAFVYAAGDSIQRDAGPGLNNEEQAAEILTLVIEHPVSWQLIKDRARQQMSELETRLSPKTMTAAVERGRSLALADVAFSILAGEKD
jgi:hypothetical protein